MKKLMLAAAMMVATISASAQVYVGGSLGFDSKKANENADNLTSFSIVPEVGYNLDENWAVGIQLGYASNEASKDFTASAFEIAPYARYTFAKSGIASFFVDGGIQFTSLGSDAKGSIFGVGFRPGIKISASNKVDLVAKLGYLGYQSANEDAQGCRDISGNQIYMKDKFGLNINNTALEFGVFFNL